MFARLTKEARELLPLFLGAVLLIVLPYVVWGWQAGPFYFVVFLGLGCLIMAGSTFGNELLHRTLPLLLAQPVPRSVLWREKMLVLGGGLLGSLLVLLATLELAGMGSIFGESGFWVGVALVLLCSFCATPYLTLLFQQAIVGVAASCLIPAGLFAGVMLVCHEWLALEESVGVWIILGLLAVYCPVCYGLGYTRFKRFQVQDSLPSPELGLPAGVEEVLLRALNRLSGGWTGPFACLVRKELRLQRATFLLAGIFCLLAVAGATLTLGGQRDWGAAILGMDYAVFVISLPLIVGALAVAEERGWGLGEWHLSLPPSAVKQWWVKMLVALGTSLVLGLLLPVALLAAGSGLGGAHGIHLERYLQSAWLILAGHLLVTTVAVYTASFSTNTLRAVLMAFALLLGLAVGVWTGAWIAEQFAQAAFGVPAESIWGSAGGPARSWAWLEAGLAVAPLFGFFQLCGFRNWRRSGWGAGRLVAQVLLALLLVIALTLVFTVSRFG